MSEKEAAVESGAPGKGKPPAGSRLALAGGALVLGVGGALGVPLGIAGATLLGLPGGGGAGGWLLALGVLAVLCGVMVVAGALLLQRGRRAAGGALAIFFSVLGLAAGGGLLAGTLLGVAGGLRGLPSMERRRRALAAFSLLGLASLALAAWTAAFWGGLAGQESRTGEPFEGFPRSSPPKQLYVFDAAGSPDEVTLMLATLQGVVNRQEPRIYLIFEDPAFRGNATDRKWLDDLTATHGVRQVPVADAFELLDLFRGEVKGAIVYDPGLPDTVNVATTLSGLRDSIAVHPSLLPRVSARGIRAIEDLRGRWKNKFEAYEWAFERLWPESNQKMLADMKPDKLGLRDYLVQHRVFTFNLRPLQNFPAEQALFSRILAGTPRNIPLLGYIADHWPEEYVAVSLLSLFGKILVPTDYARDLSVHSGVPTKARATPAPPAPGPPENKIYVTFVISDGDNVAYTLIKMRDLWDGPARGQVPLGWTISPFLVDLAPGATEYYHRTATANDTFVGPPSGAGYIYPSLYPDLPAYLNLTRRHFQAAGLDTVWLLNMPPHYTDGLLTAYTGALGLRGIFTDYLPYPLGYPHRRLPDGTPVVGSLFTNRAEDARGALDRARHWKLLSPGEPLYLFVGLNAWGVDSVEQVRALADRLGEDFIVVRPDEMFALMRTPPGRN